MALKVDILRPDDLLNLQIECRNLKLDTSDRANPVLVAEDATQVAYLIVQFPPQTIAEEAIFESSPVNAPPEEQNKPYNKQPPRISRLSNARKSKSKTWTTDAPSFSTSCQ